MYQSASYIGSLLVNDLSVDWYAFLSLSNIGVLTFQKCLPPQWYICDEMEMGKPRLEMLMTYSI